jgi:ubiquinone/menaquinone biosynthesis C-methylase UbiE
LSTESYVPDYEKYDYTVEWRKKRLNDLAEKALIRKWLKPKGNCLELGGGFGRLTSMLGQHYPSVVMIDFSLRNLKNAQTRLDRKTVDLVKSDINRLPLRSNLFDQVLMVRIVHHLANPEKVLSEIVRVSRDRAVVIISVPNVMLTKYRRVNKNTLVQQGPQGHRIYAAPIEIYRNPALQQPLKRSTGLFENFLGAKLSRFSFLHLVDVITSPIWFLKPTIFLRYQVRKEL